jgi:hypothetical protein
MGVEKPIPTFQTDPARSRNRCHDAPNSVSRHRTINGYQVIVSNFTARQGFPSSQQLCGANSDGLHVYITTSDGSGVPTAAGVFRRSPQAAGDEPGELDHPAARLSLAVGAGLPAPCRQHRTTSHRVVSAESAAC